MDEGYIQKPLVTPLGDVIDPDDGVLNFLFDVMYDLSGGQPVLYCKYPGTTSTVEVGTPVTYNQLLLASSAATGNDGFNDMVGNEGLYRLFATLGTAKFGIRKYFEQHGEMADSLEQLLDSGLLPFDSSSVNPASGLGMLEQDAPFSIHYYKHSTDTFQLTYVAADGEEARLGISY